jgi:hypothetical protein
MQSGIAAVLNQPSPGCSKESAEHAKTLAELEALCSQAELRIEAIRKRRKLLDDLGVDVRQIRQVREPSRFREMQSRFAGTGLNQQDWLNFRMGFAGNVDSVLDQATKTIDQAILFAIEGNPRATVNPQEPPTASWPLNRLRAARDEKKKLVGIDAERQKKYDELQKTLQRQEANLRKLEADATVAKGAAERRKSLMERRRQEYTQAFRTIFEEEDVLKKLYSPLRKTLEESGGTLAKLAFLVERTVEIEKWVDAGESLMDLRLDSAFRGRGALGEKARQYLLSAWRTGTPE